MVWSYIARSTFSVSAVRMWKMFESGIDRAAGVGLADSLRIGAVVVDDDRDVLSRLCQRLQRDTSAGPRPLVKTAVMPRAKVWFFIGAPRPRRIIPPTERKDRTHGVRHPIQQLYDLPKLETAQNEAAAIVGKACQGRQKTERPVILCRGSGLNGVEVE